MSPSYELLWHGHPGCIAFAKKVAKILKESDLSHFPGAVVIRLDGTLGAGKTFFTQHLSLELGAAIGEATSPTFVIIQSYDTKPRIDHVDLYRVNDDDEFFELGMEEIFEEGELVLVEWGSKFMHLLPADHLAIEIKVVNHDDRQVTVTSNGPCSNAILQGLQT